MAVDEHQHLQVPGLERRSRLVKFVLPFVRQCQHGTFIKR
jgi:hypothetical protein